MEILLNITAAIATTKGYFIKTSASDKDFKNFEKNVNCVKTISTSSSEDYADISFENINYSVPLGFRKGRRKILQKIHGKFLSGQLTAILGSSGSGKTTLLNILSGYCVSQTERSMYVNETEDLHLLKKSSCFITHTNYLHPFLTVWESMKIAADLKLGFSISQQTKEILILELLNTLFLKKALFTKISELSGGEQKRLSIALELIENPLVIFLDEPTTGLDSLSSSQCIKLLKGLADQGRTIICTINQPSAAFFQFFDQIYILGEGQCLYQGTPENLIYFLDKINLQCPIYHSPIDYVIELTSGEYRKRYIELMNEAIQNGKNFHWAKETKFPLKTGQSKVEHNTNEVLAQNLRPQRVAQYDQFKILLNREYLRAKRDAKLTYMRLVVNVLTGLFYGTLYWQAGADGGKVRNNYSLLFCVLIHHMMSTMMLTIVAFPNEMPILTKEHFNRWYSLKMYFAASTICDIPILVLCCLLFTAIVYPMTGQPLEIHRISMFTTISILVVLTVQSFGLIVGSLFNVVNGTFIAFSLSVLMMMLAGFGEGLKDLPLNFYWASYTSYMKYGFEGIIGSIYGWERAPLYCPEDQYCHYKYPKKFLKDVMVQGDQFWVDVLGLCLLFFIFRILAFLVLCWRLRKAR